MKKRTIYFPEWLDEMIEKMAEEERRSFSSQVVYTLERLMDVAVKARDVIDVADDANVKGGL